MINKQSRYRTRKEDQGFSRVEVLIPTGMISHLKAYARALRDAHSIGAQPPLFDGMTHIEATIPKENVVHAPPAAAPERRAKLVETQKKKPDFSGGLF